MYKELCVTALPSSPAPGVNTVFAVARASPDFPWQEALTQEKSLNSFIRARFTQHMSSGAGFWPGFCCCCVTSNSRFSFHFWYQNVELWLRGCMSSRRVSPGPMLQFILHNKQPNSTPLCLRGQCEGREGDILFGTWLAAGVLLITQGCLTISGPS